MMDLIEKHLALLKRKNNVVAVFDFDYTITTKDSNSSIGVFTNYMSENYKKKKYILDYLTLKSKNKFLTRIIWKLKLVLLKRHNVGQVLNKINYKKEFRINEKILELIKILLEYDVKIIIYSSGMEMIIKNILKVYKIKNPNICIKANTLETKFFKIITPYKRILKDISLNSTVILYGDQDNDLMVYDDTQYVVKVLNDRPIIRKWNDR